MIAFGLLVLQPVLHAEFVLVDDHEIMRLTLPSAGHPLAQLGPEVLVYDLASGRVRPMYWLVRLGQAEFFRDHAAAWHASVLGFGLMSAGLLYATWRRLGAEPALALLLGAWLLVAPGVSSNWVRLGSNETIAMPFFALALFAAVQTAGRRQTQIWDAVFVLASLGAILSHESFSLAAPALAGFRLLVNGGRERASAFVVGGLGLVFTALQISVSAIAGPQSYGGAFLASPSIRGYIVNFLHNLAVVGFASNGWLVLLAGTIRLKAGEWRPAALATGVALLLVLPQLLLYARQGGFDGKYELPAVVGVAGWIAAGLAWLKPRAPRTHAIGVGCWAIAVIAYAFATWSYASFFAEDSVQLHRLVTQVAATMPQGATVGIAGDPAADYEAMLSLADYVEHAGRADIHLKVLPLATRTSYSPGEADLISRLLQTSLGQPTSLGAGDCPALGGLIVLRDDDLARRALPCLAEFERLDFSSEVLLWGGDDVSLQPRLPGFARPGYVLLVPPGRR